MSGIVNYKDMGPTAIYDAINKTKYVRLPHGMIVGILAGYTSGVLVMLLGQSRVFFSMSRDSLLQKLFSDIHPKFRTPTGTRMYSCWSSSACSPAFFSDLGLTI